LNTVATTAAHLFGLAVHVKMTSASRFYIDMAVILVGGSALAGLAGYTAGSAAAFLIDNVYLFPRLSRDEHHGIRNACIVFASATATSGGILTVMATASERLTARFVPGTSQ
jgi:hypothetical protein